ncbi:Ataxin-10 [Coemansia interrupta]|uniref:Ataxin-10 homolog n=1 Tax=Coemansia interrupta TaxID=1126814 RepID=A0A9W8HKT2_9FUNG|nr:Ataxin-10 [Coemansia interrupta]
MSCELSEKSLDKICRECSEHKQRSPHPSRPHIPTAVDEPTWQRIHELFARLQAAISSPPFEQTSMACESLGSICTFVRNAAAMDKANQEAARSAGILTDVRRALVSMTAQELTSATAMQAGASAAQALSNLATGNKEIQQWLVDEELESSKGHSGTETVYWRALCSANGQTSMAGLMLVLNSLKGDGELTRRFCKTESGRMVAYRIGEMFGENADDESDVKAMLYVVLSQFVRYGCLPELLTETPGLDMYGLLDALAVYCNENPGPGSLADVAGDAGLAASLSSVLQSVHTVLEQVWGDDQGSSVNTAELVSAHRSLGSALSSLGSLTTDCSPLTVDLMISAHVLHRTVALLALLNKHLPRIESASALQQKKKQEEESTTRPLFMFKRNLIRILGNLAHGHGAAQDLARELGGLALVLDHMKIDDNHPFIKEYAIVALRSLVEGNAQSQEFIEKMNKVGDAPPTGGDLI